MKKVFISYRRSDTQGIAGRLYDGLEFRLGKDSVFFDIDSIPLGTDFREHVRVTLDQCGVLLVLIGSRWIETMPDGRPRLDHPDDLVRVEIEAALERRVPVVPVLIDLTPMPGAEQLPGALSALAYRNAVRVDSGIDFRNHLTRLVAGISPYIGGNAGEAVPSAERPPAVEVAHAGRADASGDALSTRLDGNPALRVEEHTDTAPAVGRETSVEGVPGLVSPIPLPRPAGSRRPWIVGAVALLALLIVYWVLSLSLSGAAAGVDEGLRTLVLPLRAASTPVLPQPPSDLATLLQPDVDKGLVDVIPKAGLTTVRISSDRLFADGSAKVENAQTALLSRIASALRDAPGQVVVTGHTDDTQTRTEQFPSSFHLSDERARAVAAILVHEGVAAERVRSEGRANAESLVPNDFPARRALNRRIEVTLYKPFVMARPVAAKGAS